MSWNGDQMNFKMVIGMLQCEKHTMENDARQGWISNFHHHTQVLQAGIILIGFCQIVKLKRLKRQSLGTYMLWKVFLTPLASVCQYQIISNCYDQNSFQMRKPTDKGRTTMSAQR